MLDRNNSKIKRGMKTSAVFSLEFLTEEADSREEVERKKKQVKTNPMIAKHAQGRWSSGWM